MDQLTEHDIKEAFSIWSHAHYGHAATDRELQPFLSLDPMTGWLGKVRRAQLLSAGQVAARLGMARQSYWRLEQAEEFNGRLSLASLRRCAEALDCDLVYALRPKNGRAFARQIWDEILVEVKDKPLLRTPVRHLRVLRLAALVRNKMYDPLFRRRKSWGKNTDDEAFEHARFLKLFRMKVPNSVAKVPPLAPPCQTVSK